MKNCAEGKGAACCLWRSFFKRSGGQGVFLATIHHELAEQKFQHEIGNHGEGEKEKIMPAGLFRHMAKPSGKPFAARGNRRLKLF